MRSERWRIGWPAGLATVGFVVALGIRPVTTGRIVAGYVLALAAIAAAALVRAIARRIDRDSPSELEHALTRKPEAPGRPPELVRVERDVRLGMTNAGYLHTRLLPVAREVAAARLRAHNVDLERHRDAARRMLGDETWELLRPDRPAPADLYAPGLSAKRVREVVETLERL